jgi:hypothetical protein
MRYGSGLRFDEDDGGLFLNPSTVAKSQRQAIHGTNRERQPYGLSEFTANGEINALNPFCPRPGFQKRLGHAKYQWVLRHFW